MEDDIKFTPDTKLSHIAYGKDLRPCMNIDFFAFIRSIIMSGPLVSGCAIEIAPKRYLIRGTSTEMGPGKVYRVVNTEEEDLLEAWTKFYNEEKI